MVSFAIPLAVELSVWIGVAACGYPISWRVVRKISPSFALMKRPAISASAAEDMTCLMMPEMVRMAPLLRRGLVAVFVVPRNRCPPARLWPFATDK